MSQCPNCMYVGNTIPHPIDGRASTGVQCWGVRRGGASVPSRALDQLKSIGAVTTAAAIAKPAKVKKVRTPKPPKVPKPRGVVHYDDAPAEPATVKWSGTSAGSRTNRIPDHAIAQTAATASTAVPNTAHTRVRRGKRRA